MRSEQMAAGQSKIIRVEAFDGYSFGITLESGHTILLELGERIREPAFAALAESGGFYTPRTDGEKIYWSDGTSITLEEVLEILLFHGDGHNNKVSMRRNKFMTRTWKQIGSLILSLCMVMTILPTVAFAETDTKDSGSGLGTSGKITDFVALAEDIAARTVESGTPENELNLPTELNATVTKTVTTTADSAVTATVSGNDTVIDSEAQEPEPQEETEEIQEETTVDVSGWTSDPAYSPAYDAEESNTYVFTPTLALPEGLTLAKGVSAPTVTVTVQEEPATLQARGAIAPMGNTTVPGASTGVTATPENGDKILLIPYNPSNGFAIGLRDYTIGSSKLYWDNLISGDYSNTPWEKDNLPSLGELPYDFIAYYPNVPFLDVAFYGFNAATAADPDLLGAKITGVSKGETVDLAFNHLMHKLVVNLSSAAYTEADLNNATITLKNLHSTADIDHTAALIIPSAASGADAYPQEQGAATSFIVAPQNLSAVGTDMIEIAIEGKTLAYKIPADLTVLESGKVLTLNLGLEEDNVTLNDKTVSDWPCDGSVSLDFPVWMITTASLLNGTVGTAYSQTLNVTGDTAVTWSIDSGALPAGMMLNGSTGEISGSPTTAETAIFTVKASNGTSYDTKALSITIAAAPTYAVTVNGGTGSGNCAAGETVTITANAPVVGQRFKEWSVSPTVTFTSGTTKNNQTAKFTMPDQAVTVEAVYEAIPQGTTAVTGVTLNKTRVSLYSNTTPNTATLTATVSPSDATNKAVTWQSGNTAVATVDANGKVTAVGNGTAVITVATTDGGYTASCTVTVTAYSSGDNSGSGGSSSSSHTTPAAITPGKTPNQPVTATASVTATAGKNGSASASLSEKSITDAIAKAQADAKAQGKTANGATVALNITMPKGATSLTANLTRGSLNSLVSAGVISLELNGTPVGVSFDTKVLAEIQKQSSGNISITIAPNTNLSASAKAMISTRPVYDLTVSYTKDGKNATVSSFGGGKATVSMPYTPAGGEAVGGLYAAYVDANGNATRIAGSAYDANSGCVMFPTTHFSLYGIGYTAPSAKFTDIATHWAKESIDYVVGRGLLSGTSETTVAPDTAMTRGMLVTALGRLANVDAKAYTANSFTDVTADSAFHPYIEWAYKNGIVQGTGNSKFEPDRAITREEIAMIFASYAKATGYTLPVTRTATTYADASGIGSAYKTAVTAMQQAGIMMGGTGNKFNPKSSATRAEVSSMLHRYIKLTIDPATAQGWAQNDDGQYLYYKDGKALTGTQTINGVKYSLNTDGTLKTGWVQDGSNWRYYTGKKLLTGWWDIGTGDSKKTYYFDAHGNMVSGKWVQIEGKWYYFNSDGSLAKSTKIDGYEVDENGVRKDK